MREGRYDSALIYFSSAIEATEVERYKAQATGSMGGVKAISAQAHAQRGQCPGVIRPSQRRPSTAITPPWRQILAASRPGSAKGNC